MKFAKPAFLLLRVALLLVARRSHRRDCRQGDGAASRRHHAGHDPADADRDPALRRRGRQRRRAQPERRAGRHRRSEALGPLRAGRSVRLHRAGRAAERRRRTSPTGGRSTRRRSSPAASRTTGDGRIMAEYRLWDVFSGQYLVGKQFFASPDNWRRLAHIIADSIYERLTGEKGYFDSRVAFVDETGGKAQRVKRLAIMDQDGANVRYADRRRGPGRHAALLAVAAGARLRDARRRRLARLSAQHRDGPARADRQFSQHGLQPALLARRAAGGAVAAAGRQRQHLQDGSAHQADDAADQLALDRHRAVLFAGRRRRSSSNRIAAASSSFTS